jgi:diguanylate cyclase (GGDEF)-like protein/putative nucleotidyltransferase with HDIG domain
MTPVARAYLATVIVSGLSAVTASLVNAQQNPLPLQWYMLAALTFISGSATVNLPTAGASISVSETFVFASVLLFGPSAGTITVALDGLVISFWMAKRRPEWYRALFNMAAPAVSIWVAAHLLFLIAGIKPLYNNQSSINALLLPLIVFAFTYFSLNSWLIAFAVAFEARISPYKVWRQNFLWLSLNYFSGASVALLLVAYTNNVDVRFIGVIVPLLFVLYLTFKTTMGRVEDATSHVQQLNRLYLSTIETLAMAIDAKDQITHGHIRRVQQYAVRLANELDVTDERLLKAIEAAALLHDMGKLAVPEHILNKPGKLTAAEFEKMKMHATVGADILAAIEFPYPVVPIVRHHHENWDGSGYPAGLKGTDIPVGARILSVVDCFDALISDRPYRPRLSDDAALAILIERRGSMYDPWVVDTFVRVHRQIAPSVVTKDHEKNVLEEIASTSQPVPLVSNDRGSQISASNAEMLMLFELARALGGESSITASGDIVAVHLRQFLPSTICVFFRYDPKHDELVAAYACGDAAFVLNGLRIGLGERLSGWVAANRQTILNSDPALDLSEELRASLPTLRSCISSPLLAADELVGVLTLYSSQAGVFNEEHQRIIEVVGRQVGPLFKKAMLPDDAVIRAPFAVSESTDQWLSSAPTRDFRSFGVRNRFTLLFIRVVDLAELSRMGGRTLAEEIMRHVARQTTGALRLADVLCRCDPDGFVAFLDDADAEMGGAVARRIHDDFRKNPFPVPGHQATTVRVSVRCVSAPQDGKSLHDLIDRLTLSSEHKTIGSSAAIH